MNECQVVARRASLLLSVMAILSGCDDGIHGELATKPIYADMSDLYYGDVCGVVGRRPEGPRINAVRVRVSDGNCAVLYLDGVDQQGSLLTYPGGRSVHLDCKGLLPMLREHHAHARVLARARQICS